MAEMGYLYLQQVIRAESVQLPPKAWLVWAKYEEFLPKAVREIASVIIFLAPVKTYFQKKQPRVKAYRT